MALIDVLADLRCSNFIRTVLESVCPTHKNIELAFLEGAEVGFYDLCVYLLPQVSDKTLLMPAVLSCARHGWLDILQLLHESIASVAQATDFSSECEKENGERSPLVRAFTASAANGQSQVFWYLMDLAFGSGEKPHPTFLLYIYANAIGSQLPFVKQIHARLAPAVHDLTCTASKRSREYFMMALLHNENCDALTFFHEQGIVTSVQGWLCDEDIFTFIVFPNNVAALKFAHQKLGLKLNTKEGREALMFARDIKRKELVAYMDPHVWGRWSWLRACYEFVKIFSL